MLLHFNTYMSVCYKLLLRIPVAARSNAWFCGRSLAEVADSNLAAVWMSLVNVVCCQVEVGEPGRTPLYLGLPSAWGSVDGDHNVFHIFVEGSLTGDSDGYK